MASVNPFFLVYSCSAKWFSLFSLLLKSLCVNRNRQTLCQFKLMLPYLSACMPFNWALCTTPQISLGWKFVSGPFLRNMMITKTMEGIDIMSVYSHTKCCATTTNNRRGKQNSALETLVLRFLRTKKLLNRKWTKIIMAAVWTLRSTL